MTISILRAASEHHRLDKPVEPPKIGISRHTTDLISRPALESSLQKWLTSFVKVPFLQVVDQGHVINVTSTGWLNLVTLCIFVWFRQVLVLRWVSLPAEIVGIHSFFAILVFGRQKTFISAKWLDVVNLSACICGEDRRWLLQDTSRWQIRHWFFSLDAQEKTVVHDIQVSQEKRVFL